MGGVEIGDRVMIGPNVNIITAGHPLDPSQRFAYIEAKPIRIGRNVWIATAATILGGVSVGDNSVVGAGAVVTMDIPANSFVAGVPAKVVRSLATERQKSRLASYEPYRARCRDHRCDQEVGGRRDLDRDARSDRSAITPPTIAHGSPPP